jgi:hypothetical protein
MMNVVLYGGALDGLEMRVPVDRPVVLVPHGCEVLAYGEAFRSERAGGAWVYEFLRCVGVRLGAPEEKGGGE